MRRQSRKLWQVGVPEGNSDDGLTGILPFDIAPIIITFVGEPVPKGRPRSTIRKAKDGRQFISTYTPRETRKYEDLLRAEAMLAMRARAPLIGPVRLVMRVYRSIPSKLKSKRNTVSCEAGVIRPVTKPDFDNYAKCIDALNGVVWGDDSQVVSFTFDKFYSTRPRLEIEASAL